MPAHVEVATLAHTNVVQTLRHFNNEVSPAHDEALHRMLLDLSGLAYGVVRAGLIGLVTLLCLATMTVDQNNPFIYFRF